MKKIAIAFSVCACLVILGINPILSQSNDTAHVLKEVEIKSLRPNFSKSNYLNDVFTANSLQFQWSDMYIKNYGLGQLSTFSVRGLGPENVSILWEGIPINSALNGLFDLNQVPNSLLQSINYAADENRLTTGGNLRLDNTKMNQNIVALSSSAYLSQLFSHKIEGNFKFKKSRLSIINQFIHGQNHFEYYNSLGARHKLEHNLVNQYNTQIQFNYNMGKFDFNTGVWYQNQDRNIPESEFYPVQTQTLMDRNFRGYIGISNSNVDFKLAYMNESQKYDDQDLSFPTSSINKVESFKATFNYKTEVTQKLKLNYILYPSLYKVKSTNLSDTSKDILEAIQQLNLSYKVNSKFSIDGGLKSQIHSSFHNFLLPSISASYSINDKFSINLIADINERNPTANDLYYGFYGNKNLRPETNYQIRNQWKFRNKNTSDKIQFIMEPYFIRSIDKINYVPDSAFRVFNIDKTTTWGINSNIEWVRRINSHNSFRTIAGFNVIDSKDQNDKHLAYVPSFKTILSLNWIHRYFEVLMQNNYTAQRYTSLANSTSLKPYLLTNVKFTYKHSLGTSLFNFSIGMDNLWNENYQEIQGNFMPLRNYYINVMTIIK